MNNIQATEVNAGVHVYCDWEELSTDVASNTSSVHVYLHMVFEYNYYISGRSWSASVDGQSRSGSWSISGSGDVVLMDDVFTVPHGSDGSRTIGISTYVDISVTSGTYGWMGSYDSGQLVVVLSTIARATQPSVSCGSRDKAADMGTAITISLPRASDGFTHTLSFAFCDVTVPIGSGIGSSASWTPDVSTLAPQITSTATEWGTIICVTYSGGTAIGTKTCVVWLHLPDSVVPTVTVPTVTDSTGLMATMGGLVQGRSSATISATGTGAYGSTISSTTYALGSQTGATITPSTAGTLSATAMVTDSRGRTSTSSTAVTVLAYGVPTISELECYRCNSAGSRLDSGAYARLTATVGVSSLDSHNTQSIAVRTDVADAGWGEWQTLTTASLVFAVGADSHAIAQVMVTDSITSSSAQASVSEVFSLMDFASDGTGIAFGAMAESGKMTLAIPWEVPDQAQARSAIDASATSHKHAAGDITSGTLAVAQGGTGCTTLSDTVTALAGASDNLRYVLSAPRVFAGSTVIQSGESIWNTLFTEAEMASKFGCTKDPQYHTSVQASNGDNGAQPVVVLGCFWSYANRRWEYKTDASTAAGPIRINYIVAVWD